VREKDLSARFAWEWAAEKAEKVESDAFGRRPEILSQRRKERKGKREGKCSGRGE